MIRRTLPHALVFALVAAAHLSGLLQPFNWHLADLRMQSASRPASGDVVLVEIDARSLQQLDVWPWPRDIHGDTIERLLTAGASEIALDVDLSARGDAAADLRLAEVLRRSEGRVVLPIFEQPGSASRPDLVTARPLPAFAEAAQLGSVNIFPSADGRVRTAETFPRLGDDKVPALFALLAGPAHLGQGTFFLDFGIDPATLPRLSYVDVHRGDFDAALVEGRKVIIGSVAVELGDEFAVPVHRNLSGGELQAMAFESLIQNRTLHPMSDWLTLVVAAAVCFVFAPRRQVESWAWSVGAAVVIILALEAVALAASAAYPAVWETGAWIVAAVLGAGVNVGRTLRSRGRQILRQRLNLMRRRHLTRGLMEHAFEGILVADGDGVVHAVNESAQRILGLDRVRMVGRHYRDLLPDIEADRRDGTLAAPITVGETVPARHHGPVELEVVRADGVPVDVEAAVTRIFADDPSAKPNWIVLAMRDISERKSVERARAEAHAKAVAADRAKTEFLANMSHELRTPLNAVIGFSEMMKSELHGPLPAPQYVSYVDNIHKSGEHLLSIINSILDISRVEVGEVRIYTDDIEVEALLGECVDIAVGWRGSSARNIVYDVAPELPPMVTDAQLLRQVVINLLSNAVKFTDDGGRIALRARLDDAKHLVISVTDDGCGIPPEDLENVMRPFFQVQSTYARNHGGTGLGLYLVSRYVLLLGGTIDLQSVVGEGTTVRLRLPLEGPHADEAPPQTTAAKSPSTPDGALAAE